MSGCIFQNPLIIPWLDQSVDITSSSQTKTNSKNDKEIEHEPYSTMTGYDGVHAEDKGPLFVEPHSKAGESNAFPAHRTHSTVPMLSYYDFYVK